MWPHVCYYIEMVWLWKYVTLYTYRSLVWCNATRLNYLLMAQTYQKRLNFKWVNLVQFLKFLFIPNVHWKCLSFPTTQLWISWMFIFYILWSAHILRHSWDNFITWRPYHACKSHKFTTSTISTNDIEVLITTMRFVIWWFILAFTLLNSLQEDQKYSIYF